MLHTPKAEDRIIWDIWLSKFHLPTMAVADELGIFQHLADSPGTSTEVAQRLSFSERGTEAVLSMLEALGLLRSSQARYELTEAARTYLLPGSPNYWGPLLRMMGVVEGIHPALIKALKSTTSTTTETEGARTGLADAWASGQMTAAMAERVSRVMHCHSLPAAVAVAEHGDFDHVKRVLDIGGGSGCFSIAIAQRFSEIRCTISDLPAVCEVARKYIAEAGVSDRVDAMPVDMFRSEWPTGYDVIFLSNIFHDWPTLTNAELARSAYKALEPGGKIVLHEMLFTESKDGPLTTAAFSILMLLRTQGKQYSLREVTQILEGSGFVDVRAKATYGYYSVVSGVKR